MKQYFFFVFLVPMLLSAQANIGNGDGITTDAQIGIIENIVDIEGSPYVNQNYKNGEATIAGSLRTVLMRYNAYSDAIEILDENNTARKLLRRKSIEATIDGKKYKIFNYTQRGQTREAYFNPLNEGHVKLLFKPKKIFIQAEKPENGYDDYDPPHFKDVSSYYIIKGDGPAHKVNLTKNQILKHLKEEAELVKKYLKNNPMNLRQVTDVAALIDYYNSLSPQPQIEETDSR